MEGQCEKRLCEGPPRKLEGLSSPLCHPLDAGRRFQKALNIQISDTQMEKLMETMKEKLGPQIT